MKIFRSLSILLTVLIAFPTLAHDHSLEPVKPELWQLSPEEIKAKVSKVRAGKDLTPESWPDGNKVAVSFSFDVDTEPVWMGFQKQSSPSYMSRGEYGVRAVPMTRPAPDRGQNELLQAALLLALPPPPAKSDNSPATVRQQSDKGVGRE